jgi:hypothetical protein
MTPQVHKSNVGLSVADRVRGRKSTGGGVGRASFARTWLVTDADVAIPNADPNSPSENAQPGQRRISASEKQVRAQIYQLPLVTDRFMCIFFFFFS